MDKLSKYRQLIKHILSEYAHHQPASNHLETQAIFDEQREHYQIVVFGWEEKKYVHYCLIHIDLKSD